MKKEMKKMEEKITTSLHLFTHYPLLLLTPKNKPLLLLFSHTKTPTPLIFSTISFSSTIIFFSLSSLSYSFISLGFFLFSILRRSTAQVLIIRVVSLIYVLHQWAFMWF